MGFMILAQPILKEAQHGINTYTVTHCVVVAFGSIASFVSVAMEIVNRIMHQGIFCARAQMTKLLLSFTATTTIA